MESWNNVMEYLHWYHIDIMLCLKIGIPAASGGLPFSRTMAMAGYPRRGIWEPNSSIAKGRWWLGGAVRWIGNPLVRSWFVVVVCISLIQFHMHPYASFHQNNNKQ